MTQISTTQVMSKQPSHFLGDSLKQQQKQKKQTKKANRILGIGSWLDQIHGSHQFPFAHSFACPSAPESARQPFGVGGRQEAWVSSPTRLSEESQSVSTNLVLCELGPGWAQLSQEDLGSVLPKE